MRRKWLSYIGFLIPFLMLAGCDSLSPSAVNDQTTSNQSSVVENVASSFESSLGSESAETDSKTDASTSTSGSSSSTSEAEVSSDSMVEQSKESSATNVKPALPGDHLEEILPLIHQVTNNIYKSEAYLFIPSNVDDHTVQVEVRRDNGSDPSHANLVAMFRYDTQTKRLSQQDIMSGEWQTLKGQ
ncbi:MAG: hypothetical protein Q4A55_03995 [Aerococcus sp.]|nr:hypothetical protein [Aerococcus sp.]